MPIRFTGGQVRSQYICLFFLKSLSKSESFFFFFFFFFFFKTKVRYFRKLRASSVAAAARKKELRAALHPRPAPKQVEHVEDILFKNGLRFVRPGGQKILGVTVEGIPIESVAAGKQ